MEFAIQVSGAWDDVLAAARYAEGKGLPALALPDHYLMARDEEAAPDGLPSEWRGAYRRGTADR